MNWFRNRRAEMLEQELVDQRHDHALEVQLILKLNRDHIESIQALNLTLQYEAMRELGETKKAHADELARAINEHEITRNELQRVLRILHPAMQSVEIPGSTVSTSSQPPQEQPKKLAPSGTPWQKVQAFYKEHEARIRVQIEIRGKAEGRIEWRYKLRTAPGITPQAERVCTTVTR